MTSSTSPAAQERAGERRSAFEQTGRIPPANSWPRARRAGRGCAAARSGGGRGRRPGAAGRELAQPHHGARRGWRLAGQRLRRSMPRTASRGSSARRCRCRPRRRRTSARSRCTSARAAGPVIQRELPSAAAIRPSRVAANFQVTNGRRCASRRSRRALTRLGLGGEQAALDVDARGAQRLARRRRPRVRVGDGVHHPARRRPRSAPAVHGPVRPVWLHGSRVTTAVPPRARSPAAPARRPRRAGRRPAVRSPRATISPAGRGPRQPTRGSGPG